MALPTVEITPENVAGLVVGEGCFYVESAPDPKYRSGWRIRPAFCIEMRHDERGVLEEVAAHLQCGKVYDLDFGRYSGYEERGWVPHVKLRVGNLKELHEKVVPFFREHRLFGRKATAFELFAEIVDRLAQREHQRPDGLRQLRELATALSAHNRRGLPTSPSTV